MIVMFSTSNRWISRVIRKMTNAEVSHVGLIALVDGVPTILHADVGGVQFTPFPRFIKENRIVAMYEEAKCTRICVGGAVACIGLGYDYSGLIWKGVWRWLKLKLRYPFKSPKAMVCSEFVARAIPSFGSFDPERVTPQELLEFSRGSADFKRASLE